MLRTGTTTFECKSGYGLSTARELRALQLATELQGIVSQVTTRTALLAHAIPDGYTSNTWMDEVEQMLPEALEHATALDIFVESIASAIFNRLVARSGARGFVAKAELSGAALESLLG